jgi:hypothetical protein
MGDAAKTAEELAATREQVNSGGGNPNGLWRHFGDVGEIVTVYRTKDGEIALNVLFADGAIVDLSIKSVSVQSSAVPPRSRCSRPLVR